MSDLWWPKAIRKPRLVLRLPRMPQLRMPSRWILFGISLGIYYFVISGTIFDLSYPGYGLFGSSSWLYGALYGQYVIEGVIGGVFYFLGFLGFYFTYQSTRHIYRPRYANMMLAVGWFLILASFIGCSFLIYQKLHPAAVTS
jgi:hypothetical protein